MHGYNIHKICALKGKCEQSLPQTETKYHKICSYIESTEEVFSSTT